MKNIFLTILTLIITIPCSLIAQNFVDTEIDDLAEKIASRVDQKNATFKKKNKINNVLVEDFTDIEGKVSKLSASLSEEFSLALSNSGLSFSITGTYDLAEAPKSKGGLDFKKTLASAKRTINEATTDTDYAINEKNRKALKTAGGVAGIEGISINKNSSRYKGIDAVVTGTLTESNDQYRLLIKVIRTSSDNAMIANAKGFITKTPFILQLEEEENNRLVNSSNDRFTEKGGSRNNISSNAQQVFESNNTKVELLDIKQVGQNIECYFRITNTGPDLDFYLYGARSGGKLIDSNNSYDYLATQVELGELINNQRVVKTLVTNNPVEAKVTFGGVARDVQEIAKLNVKCHGHGGSFSIEFRDVEVN